MKTLKIKDIEIEIRRKQIKNLHLSVYPPDGLVRASVPEQMREDALRVYLIEKLGWIRKQQEKIRSQERESVREYINRESHYFRGERYLLEIETTSQASYIELTPQKMVLHMNKLASESTRHRLVLDFYRSSLKKEIPAIIAAYEPRLGVQVEEFGVKQMKTRWGTCNPDAGRIWINLELAKKPPACLEYIVVHEMAHLIERTHNQRFTELMDAHLPLWRKYREQLNRLPVRHEHWEY